MISRRIDTVAKEGRASHRRLNDRVLFDPTFHILSAAIITGSLLA